MTTISIICSGLSDTRGTQELQCSKAIKFVLMATLIIVSFGAIIAAIRFFPPGGLERKAIMAASGVLLCAAHGIVFLKCVKKTKQVDLLKTLSDDAKLPPLDLVCLKNNEKLRCWLTRLYDVKDYQNKETREALAKRIYAAIKMAEQDEKFAEVFMECLEEADSTCGDRIALSLLYIGINLNIQESREKGDLKELAMLLGHGTWALGELTACSQQIINQKREGVDEIETYLALPIKLKSSLQLPIDVTDMLHFKCSTVTEEDLKVAHSLVYSLLSNKKTYFEFLAKNKTWEEALKVHEKSRDRYAEVLNEREKQLDDCKFGEETAIQATFETELCMLTETLLTEVGLPPFLN